MASEEERIRKELEAARVDKVSYLRLYLKKKVLQKKDYLKCKLKLRQKLSVRLLDNNL